MIMTVIIIVILTIFITGVVLSLKSIFRNGSSDSGTQNIVVNRKVVADQGVNTKNLNYGKDSGALFEAEQKEYGTVVRRGGRHRNWEVQFGVIGTGKKQKMVFSTRMAIGRKNASGSKYPFLEIKDDKMVSSIHCYLEGDQGILVVRDAGSLNHTYLNGVRVDYPMEIPQGSVIQVGNSKLHIQYTYQ